MRNLLLLLAICSYCYVTKGCDLPCGKPTTVDCRGCDLTRNPSRYFANTCTCGFYHCVVDQYGGFIVYDMPCPPCECWDQDKLTCVYDPSADSADCTQTVEPENIVSDCTTCTASGPGYSTTFEIVPDDPMHYYMYVGSTKVMMPCPSGTHFSVKECHCVPSGNIADIGPFMCLTFDEDNPFDTLTGVYVDPKNVEIVNGGIVMNAARFNGLDSNIEIPAFTNREIPTMSISLWFKRDSSGTYTTEALVSNDDCLPCVHDPSIRLLSNSPEYVSGGYRTTSVSTQINAFTNIEANGTDWIHVAMVYDGQEISLFVNGDEKASVQASGFIQAVPTPLLIGSMYNTSFFAGLMDQICFYDYALTDTQVSNLVSDPSNVMFPADN